VPWPAGTARLSCCDSAFSCRPLGPIRTTGHHAPYARDGLVSGFGTAHVVPVVAAVATAAAALCRIVFSWAVPGATTKIASKIVCVNCIIMIHPHPFSTGAAGPCFPRVRVR
jgi:hypothetical protein